MNKVRKILFIFLFLISNKIHSQDTLGVYQIIQKLAGPEMKGRGYIGRGEKLAADYLYKKLEENNLKLAGTSYLQKFTISVNTFPEEIILTVNNKSMVEGRDFIVDATSPSFKKKCEVVKIGKEKIPFGRQINLKALKGKVLLIDTAGCNSEDKKWLNEIRYDVAMSGAVVWVTDKLTWTVSDQRSPFPIVYVLRKSLPENISELQLKIKSKFIKEYETQNVIGILPGTQKDSFIIISAHYDHLGKMGNAIFPGASDNASGTSMLLKLAEYYSQAITPPKYSIAFIFFGAEEAGIKGSKYFTEHPLVDLQKIKFVINLDLMGNGEKGITVVNANVFPEHFRKLEEINTEKNYFTFMGKRGKAMNSDHYYFSELGIPSFFIYTMGGTGNYHDIGDIPETLTFKGYLNMMKLVVNFMDSF